MDEVTVPPKLKLAESAATVTVATLFEPSKVKVNTALVNVIAPPRRLPEMGP